MGVTTIENQGLNMHLPGVVYLQYNTVVTTVIRRDYAWFDGFKVSRGQVSMR